MNIHSAKRKKKIEKIEKNALNFQLFGLLHSFESLSFILS